MKPLGIALAATLIIGQTTSTVTADDALIRQLILLNLSIRVVDTCNLGTGTTYRQTLVGLLAEVEPYAEPDDLLGTRAAAQRVGFDCSPANLHVQRVLRGIENIKTNTR